MQMLTADNGV